MKSVLLVMLLLTLSPLPVAAEQGMDQEVTVVGEDETLMTVPDPPAAEAQEIPGPDLAPPPTPDVPLVLPPDPAVPAPPAGQDPPGPS